MYVLCLLPCRAGSSASSELPGLRPDGSVLLPNQWSLRPVGRQVPLGDLPVNIAVHPSGAFAAVLHCGYGPHEIAVVDIAAAKITSRIAVEEAFYGLAFSPDGLHLYCSGAGQELIHAFDFVQGHLRPSRDYRLRPADQRGVPSGVAVSADGAQIWAANLWNHRLSQVDLASGAVKMEINFLPNSAPTSTLLPPPADPDLAAATKRSEASHDPAALGAPFPYACVLDEARQRVYVSLWARAAVGVVDARTGQIETSWPTEEHPCEMVLDPAHNRLFVANANRNSVSILDTQTGATVELLSSSLHPSEPPGSTPNSLALSADASLLFVANACNNDVALFDVSKPGASRSLGFIPVGWYPTSVRLTPDGRHLLVANGKGLMSKANRNGPRPGFKESHWTVQEYIAGLFLGTLSIIDLPKRDKLEEQMREYTLRAYRCSPHDDRPEGRKPGNAVPACLGDPTPIKHCLYIVKENRTYDQVLGDLAQGNGDPALCLFPESVTPNHHALARQFVLLDNFYVESEVSADGHEWSMAAYATDFVEKTWPMNYGHNQRGKFPYPAEGKFAVALPSSGYLWDRARQAGVSYRSYGEFIDNGARLTDPATTQMPGLVGHFDPGFHGWDLDYPDVKRAERFIAELHRFEKEGRMPSLQILRLPNDHTYGTSTGKPTPRALVADNDRALGMVIEAISHSKFWSTTAIFVVEDDAQNGCDHVDAHRTIAFAVSPYTRRGTVDSTLYSTCSMLRTMELILGMKPLTQFDSSATPMFRSFQAKASLQPYTARPITIDLQERNTASTWGSQDSDTMDFSCADAADDLQLNAAVWHSIKGPDDPMPAPVRAAFHLGRADNDD